MPDDMILHVLSFLSPSDLTPVSKEFVHLFRSDIVWRLHTDVVKDCFVEYVWQRRLNNYTFQYKRMWTQGCLGRLEPPKKNVNLYSARNAPK